MSPPGRHYSAGAAAVYGQGLRSRWEQALDPGLATGHKLTLPDLPRRPLRSLGVVTPLFLTPAPHDGGWYRSHSRKALEAASVGPPPGRCWDVVV